MKLNVYEVICFRQTHIKWEESSLMMLVDSYHSRSTVYRVSIWRSLAWKKSSYSTTSNVKTFIILAQMMKKLPGKDLMPNFQWDLPMHGQRERALIIFSFIFDTLRERHKVMPCVACFFEGSAVHRQRQKQHQPYQSWLGVEGSGLSPGGWRYQPAFSLYILHLERAHFSPLFQITSAAKKPDR